MSEQHTPEPWPSIERYSTNSARLNAADYERARICVNACAGISNEALERGPDSVFIYAADMTRERDQLQAALSATVEQRDRLLAAATKVIAFRVGDLPTLGFLRDTGKSRDAIGELASALSSIERATESEGEKE